MFHYTVVETKEQKPYGQYTFPNNFRFSREQRKKDEFLHFQAFIKSKFTLDPKTDLLIFQCKNQNNI